MVISAKIHLAAVQEELYREGSGYDCLASYSPDLNLDEYIRGVMKDHVEDYSPDIDCGSKEPPG